jgi:hypothetical protein
MQTVMNFYIGLASFQNAVLFFSLRHSHFSRVPGIQVVPFSNLTYSLEV